MKKMNKAKVLFLLVISLLCNDVLRAQESKNLFWESVGAVAAVVAAGVGIGKFVEWCFTETNRQLIERANKEYEKAISYIDSIMLFEGTYNLNRITVYETYPQQYRFAPITLQDRHLIFDTLYEPSLYGLARFWFDRGISSYSYINDIVVTKNELQSLSRKLHVRINEKKGVYVEYSEAQELSAMNHIACKIDAYLSHLTLFCDYVTLHKGYFNLFESEAYLYKQYDAELRIIKSGNAYHTMIHDLRQLVVWHYSAKQYPFITFVSVITADIAELALRIQSVSYHYTERMGYARWMLDSLEWIKRAIASDERYAAEQYQKEVERLERERVEALQEKARIERMQLAAQREQNRLLAQNNMIQAQRLTHERYADNNCHANVTVVVR